MKNVSSEFREKLNNGNRNYIKSAKITLKDGTELNLTDKVFWNNGVKIEDATSNQNSFDTGSVIIGQLTLSINNMYDDYSDYDFTDAKITNVSVGMKLSNDVIESLQYGQYTVNETAYNGSIITLTAYDNMHKFDQPYSKSTLSYPATLLQIVQDACTKCDVQLGSFDFSHNDFVIQNRPEDESITFRNILQWVAQISCCYCKIDPQGRLILGWYDTDILENMFLLNGGNFLNWESTKDTVSGGSFNPWTEGELISGGDFSASSDYHLIHSFNSLTLATDDVVITGVKVVEEVDGEEGVETKTYQSGTEGYVLSVEGNKLIQETGMTVVGFLAEKLIGLRFRSFNASILSDPTIESGDIAILTDRKGNTYKTIITSNTFQPGNFQNISCGAETPARKSATRYSQVTQIYVDYRREIQKERSEREKALEELGNRIENSSGVFTTVEKQPDGSNIYYLHNKPQLADSDIIWKMTAEAWGVSTDGGKTYNAGMTVDGDTIVRILTATGVNADWINAGAIQVTDDDGNVIFSVDMDTKQVIISGDSVRIGGKTATAAIDDVLQESKDYSDGKLANFADTVTENLSSLQAQVDGQIETYYEDYEPTLQNYPASEWTTTEERKKHEGDLFYWKSKGYAYRFFQDGATWKWQLVQDTDITQAMAAAEKAQDTADGKRRVFVVTPQPPYDIGDLWTNGKDILTCSTSRPAGSVYVSTDWEKKNTYTDDTVANEALEEAKKARNLNMILDNEFQGIYTDYSGNIASFPAVSTTVQALYGHTDVSVNCTYSIEKSASVTGSWNNATRTYTVTGLSADSGWVDITASYLNLFTVTKRFKVEKIKGGEPGEEGQQGEQGVSVTGTDLTYQVSSSGTAIPTGFWSSSIPLASPGQYLWTRTQFNYSDDSHSYSYSVGKIGENGAPGQNGTDGRGISQVVNYYLATAAASGVTTSTSGWTTTVQTITTKKKYLWNYEKIVYTSGSSETTTPCIIGAYGNTGAAGAPGKDGADGTDGKDGATGNGISSITEHYAVSASNTTPPTSWSTTVPTMTVTKKYLWNYETINYTNGNSVNTAKRVIGVYGNTGDKGDKGDTGAPGQNGTDGRGISSTEIRYQASTSGTAIPTGTWTSSVPSVSAGQYLWTRTITTYTDNTTTTSYSVGKMGENGAAGTPARIFIIEPSVNLLKRSKDNTISPNFIEFKSYYRDGDNANRVAYSGRWVIEETADGDVWNTIYTSSSDENTVIHYVYSLFSDSDGSAIASSNGDTIGIPRDVVAIRAKLYASGGTTNLLDMQSVSVVVDVDALTHDEIFDLLTNNGQIKGIYKEGNDLYINATYIKSGSLTLGGSGNENGWLRILDDSGSQIGQWTNAGITVNKGSFYCKTETTGSSIYGGRMHLTYGEDDVGFIGTNVFSGTGKHGIVFDLGIEGDYMTWGAQLETGGAYIAKILYTRSAFSNYDADTLNIGCDIDMHRYDIKNVHLQNIYTINGYNVIDGEFNVVTSITNTGSGGITWRYGTVRIRDGLITHWPS